MMKIVHNVDMPFARGRGRPTKYPFKDMKVGDCIEFKTKEEYLYGQSAASSYARKYGGSFCGRTISYGDYKIWKVK